jgi:hypothetical protein
VKPAVAIVAVAVVAASAWALLRAPEPPPAEVTAEAPRRPASPRRDGPGPGLADAVQRALDPPPEPEALRRTPPVGRVEAEAGFERLMESLEALADRDERLPRARRDELYRNVNDAFAAFSATLDPGNPADMQALEDANVRMKAMLSELRITAVPKRLPEPP